MLIVWVLVVLAALSWAYYRYGYVPYQVFKRMGVPGPTPLPVLGNLPAMIMSDNKMVIFGDWAKQYGSLCGIYSGFLPALIVTDHQMLQQIFTTKFKYFSDRIDLVLLNTKMTGLPLGLFECKPRRWKHVRKVTSPAFTNMKLNKMLNHINGSYSVLLERMVEESIKKHNIDVMKLNKDFVLEVSIIAVLGHKLEVQRGEGGELKQGIDMASDACHEKYGSVLSAMLYIPTQFCIATVLPWLQPLLHWLSPVAHLPRFRRIKAIMEGFVRERRKIMDAGQVKDSCVLDLLVADSVSGKGGVDEDEIVSNCFNFLMAAYDTTSFTLTCCSHLLATHPRVQDKLCAQIDAYWGEHEGVSCSTVAQDLSYLDMVLDETLRLYPPSPRIVRICIQNTEVCGLEIPEGVTITVPVDYLHSQKEVWGDPDVFRPERFEEEESRSRPPCAYIPLGQGPRNCVGMKLAKLMIKTALVAVLKTHRLITTPSTVGTIQTKSSALTACSKSDIFLDIETRKIIK